MNTVMNDSGVNIDLQSLHTERFLVFSLWFSGEDYVSLVHNDPILITASLNMVMNDCGMDSETSLKRVHEEIPGFNFMFLWRDPCHSGRQ